MKSSTTALLCVLALSASALPILAQAGAGSAVHFGVMGGLTVPLSDLSAIEKKGWNAGALLSVGAPHSALSYRFEAQWQQLGGKDYLSLGEFVEQTIRPHSPRRGLV